MSRTYMIFIASIAGALTLALIVLAGCGGGGGPISSGGSGAVSPSAAFMALLPAGQKGSAYVGSTSCASCHTGHPGSETAQVDLVAFALTKHSKIGVLCESCHGPAGKHVANPTSDNILVYPNLTRSEVCAQCHGPMASDFNASAHAKATEDVLVSAGKGVTATTQTASSGRTCLRCHSAPLRTELIEENKYLGLTRSQVDAEILALGPDEIKAYAEATTQTASCATCHEPMATTGVVMVTTVNGGIEDAQVRRATSITDTADIRSGATVAAYTDVAQMCGTCHNSRGGKSDDAAIASSTSRPPFHHGPQVNALLGISGVETVTGTNGLPVSSPPPVRTTAHATAPDQCVHCHMPAGSHTMTVSFDKSCSPCHTAADAAARYAIRGEIEQHLYVIQTRLQAWAAAKFGDAYSWDYTSQIPSGHVVPTSSQESAIPIEVKRARHNFYYVLSDSSFGIHNSTYIRYLLNIVDQNLDTLDATKSVSRAAAPPQVVKAALAAAMARFRRAQREGTD
jgi:hypothetical protein